MYCLNGWKALFSVMCKDEYEGLFTVDCMTDSTSDEGKLYF